MRSANKNLSDSWVTSGMFLLAFSYLAFLAAAENTSIDKRKEENVDGDFLFNNFYNIFKIFMVMLTFSSGFYVTNKIYRICKKESFHLGSLGLIITKNVDHFAINLDKKFSTLQEMKELSFQMKNEEREVRYYLKTPFSVANYFELMKKEFSSAETAEKVKNLYFSREPLNLIEESFFYAFMEGVFYAQLQKEVSQYAWLSIKFEGGVWKVENKTNKALQKYINSKEGCTFLKDIKETTYKMLQKSFVVSIEEVVDYLEACSKKINALKEAMDLEKKVDEQESAWSVESKRRALQLKIDEKNAKNKEKRLKNLLLAKNVFLTEGDFFEANSEDQLTLVSHAIDIKLGADPETISLSKEDLNDFRSMFEKHFVELKNADLLSDDFNEKIESIKSKIPEFRDRCLLRFCWKEKLAQCFIDNIEKQEAISIIENKKDSLFSVSFNPLSLEFNINVIQGEERNKKLLLDCLSKTKEGMFLFSPEGLPVSIENLKTALWLFNKKMQSQKVLSRVLEQTDILGEAVFETNPKDDDTFIYRDKINGKFLMVNGGKILLKPFAEEGEALSQDKISEHFQTYMHNVVFFPYINLLNAKLKMISENLVFVFKSFDRKQGVELKINLAQLTDEKEKRLFKASMFEECRVKFKENEGTIFIVFDALTDFSNALGSFVGKLRENKKKNTISPETSNSAASFFNERAYLSNAKTIKKDPVVFNCYKYFKDLPQKPILIADPQLTELLNKIPQEDVSLQDEVAIRELAILLIKIFSFCYEYLADFQKEALLSTYRNEIIHQLCFSIAFGFNPNGLRKLFANAKIHKNSQVLISALKEYMDENPLSFLPMTPETQMARTIDMKSTIALIAREILFASRRSALQKEAMEFSLFFIGELWGKAQEKPYCDPELNAIFIKCFQFRNALAHWNTVQLASMDPNDILQAFGSSPNNSDEDEELNNIQMLMW